MSDPDEVDNLATESDYEDAFESELANEELLMRRGIQYYFSVNTDQIPPALLISGSPALSAQIGTNTHAFPLGPKPHYGKNKIKTSHYTWWNFVPLNLAVQFRHYYNIYFLIAAILSLIPSISPLNPFATVLPLVIVIVLTFIKDGYADYKRHKVDRIVNDRKVLVCRHSGGPWQTLKSEEILVGDLVLLKRDEKIPADLFLLKVSHADEIRNEGGCFIETSDLDGESNIKRKEIPPLLRDFMYKKRKIQMELEYSGTVEDEKKLCSTFEGLVECEAPNDSIHSFIGLLKVKNIQGHFIRSPPLSPVAYAQSSEKPLLARQTHKKDLSSPSSIQESIFKEILTIPLGYQHFVPRGSSLKSTDFIIGVVTYVGPNTKVFKNLKKRKRGKDSSLTRALNRLILIVFSFNFIVIALATLFGGLYLVSLKTCRLREL